MSKGIQRAKAMRFLALHQEGLLVLPNIWSPIGARILEANGYSAAATASAAISNLLGYMDGERIKLSTMLDIVKRIAGCVDIPVTADIEMGYADSFSELEETIEQIIASGVVGINIEDSVDDGCRLRVIDEQCERIQAVRKAAEGQDLHLVINARIDSFISGVHVKPEECLADAIARAKAYADAGADCVFPVGPGDRVTISKLRENISGPINTIASEKSENLNVLKELGVNRVSFGPFVFRSCLKKFIDIVDDLSKMQGYKSFSENTLSADGTKKYLKTVKEK